MTFVDLQQTQLLEKKGGGDSHMIKFHFSLIPHPQKLSLSCIHLVHR